MRNPGEGEVRALAVRVDNEFARQAIAGYLAEAGYEVSVQHKMPDVDGAWITISRCFGGPGALVIGERKGKDEQTAD